MQRTVAANGARDCFSPDGGLRLVALSREIPFVNTAAAALRRLGSERLIKGSTYAAL
jgi:hypothetical protein